MRLQAQHPVDHLSTNGLEHLGPIDIGFLVKAGLELDHHHDLLATAHRLPEQVHHLGVGASAVDGLADRQHLRVGNRLAQEIEHAVEALKGLVQTNIALLEALKNILTCGQLQGVAGLVGRPHQRGIAHQINELGQPVQIDRTLHPVQRLIGQRKLLEQKICQVGTAARRHLQPHRLAKLPMLQARAQGRAQIGHIGLLHCQFRIAGDAKLRKLQHLATRKEFVQMRANHARERNEKPAASARALRQGDDAGQHPRHLDDGDLVVTAKRVLALQPHNKVERLVGHHREGMRRIQTHRHQQRANLAPEIALHPSALLGIALAMGHDLDALVLELPRQGVVVKRVLTFDQLVGCGRKLDEDGIRRAATARCAHVRRHPDLKKLVEVGRDDAQIAQPLEQGHVLTGDHGQHSLVKGQNAAVAVKQSHGRRCCEASALR